MHLELAALGRKNKRIFFGELVVAPTFHGRLPIRQALLHEVELLAIVGVERDGLLVELQTAGGRVPYAVLAVHVIAFRQRTNGAFLLHSVPSKTQRSSDIVVQHRFVQLIDRSKSLVLKTHLLEEQVENIEVALRFVQGLRRLLVVKNVHRRLTSGAFALEVVASGQHDIGVIDGRSHHHISHNKQFHLVEELAPLHAAHLRSEQVVVPDVERLNVDVRFAVFSRIHAVQKSGRIEQIAFGSIRGINKSVRHPTKRAFRSEPPLKPVPGLPTCPAIMVMAKMEAYVATPFV